jgi:hypothetical protein
VLEWPEFVDRASLDGWLEAHAGQDFSGDVYARRRGTAR